MDAYYDTGTLAPLYVEEAFSSTINAWVAGRVEPIPLNQFQRLELENAMRQKVFRGEIDDERLARILTDVGEDLERGRLVVRPANWIRALDQARVIGERVTAKTGCRTLDLIHVAIAVQWGCSVFVSADERQLAAAKTQGLRAVDVRDLHRRRGGGQSEPGVIRESPSRYRATRRVRHGAAGNTKITKKKRRGHADAARLT